MVFTNWKKMSLSVPESYDESIHAMEELLNEQENGSFENSNESPSGLVVF